jgi:hypothetical protein
MDSAPGLLLWYDDHKAFDVVLHSHYSAALQQQQTRHTVALPLLRAHPKSVDLDVVSQGRHLKANYIFEHAHERATSPKVGHGCYVCVKIPHGAPAVDKIVWLGSRHARVAVVEAINTIGIPDFGQANAGAE